MNLQSDCNDQGLTEPGNIVEFQGYSQSVDNLLTNEVDAVTTDDAILAVHLRQHSGDYRQVCWVAQCRNMVGSRRMSAGSGTGGGAGYRLSDQVRVDLSEAADLVAEAESRIAAEQPALALMAARRAAHLLDGGEVLAGEPAAPWVEPARAWHGELLRRARYTTAEAALRLGDIPAADAAAEAAVAADAFDEAACRMLMRARHAAGEPARALLIYQRLRTILAAELGVDPASPTRDLHLAILRDAS